MTKKEILESLGYDPKNPQDVEKFYAQYPTEESFQMAMGGMVDEYKKGGWIQKATASIKRRGTEGVCTGSNFGGPSCRPGTKRYALAKTFRKMAKARKKEDGGMVEMYEEGGENSTWKEGPVSQRDSVANMARNTMIWEANRGSRAGTGLSDFGNPALPPGASINESVDWYMQNIYPKLEAYPTAMEKASAGDFLYNTGKNLLNYTDWDNRKNDAAALASWEEKIKTLTPNERRIALNNARDKYYQNTAPAGSTWDLKTQGPHPAYWNTWYGRQHATDQYIPLTDQDVTNRANKKFYPAKKENGGVVDVYQLMGMPTPSMYGMGGYASIGTYSDVISQKNHSNMGYAMGGAVDYPEGLSTFAMGGTPQEQPMTLTELNDAYSKAKPIAQYTNFPKHPKVGIDPRGTVTGTVDEQGNPVQINTEGSEANWKLGNGENFITVANNGGKLSTKRALAFYKNGDGKALAALMHNTAERKAKKEAANQVGIGKYGGPVKGMYAKGGMIPKYDGGAGVINNSAPNSWNWGNPYVVNPMEGPMGVTASMPDIMGTFTAPGSNFYSDSFDQGNALGALQNMQNPQLKTSFNQWSTYNTSPFNTSSLVPNMPNVSGQYNYPGNTPPTQQARSLPSYNMNNYLNNMRQQGIRNSQDVNIPTIARSGFDASGNPVSINPNMPSNYVPPGYQGTPTSKSIDLGKYAPEIAMATPIAWNLIQAMKKPTQVPKDLGMISTDFKAPRISADAAIRGIREQAALGKYNMRQLPGSNVMAGLSNLATNRMAATADTYEDLRNKQAMLDYQAAAQRKAYEQFNAEQVRANYELQSQADDVPGEFAKAGMSQIGQVGDIMNRNKMTREFLNRAYPKRTNVTIPGLSDMDISGYTSGGQRTFRNPNTKGFLNYSRPSLGKSIFG